MFKNLLLVAAGGAAGSCVRYLLSRWSAGIWLAFPQAGTMLVNLFGCLLIGILFGCAERAQLMNPAPMLLLVTGFCGGFTTFSTFAADAVGLAGRGQMLIALAYVAVSVAGGMALMFAGRLLALKALA